MRSREAWLKSPPARKKGSSWATGTEGPSSSWMRVRGSGGGGEGEADADTDPDPDADPDPDPDADPDPDPDADPDADPDPDPDSVSDPAAAPGVCVSGCAPRQAGMARSKRTNRRMVSPSERPSFERGGL
jgi:hypothetical protein